MHDVKTTLTDLNGKLVFDIGANIGLKSLEYKKLGAIVVAVEPLSDLTRNQNFNGVTTINACVSDHVGTVEFYRSKDAVLSTCVAKWMTEGRFKGRGYVATPTVVPCTTLDELIAVYGVPYLIKIDVEGHEKEALSGLTQRVVAVQYEYTQEFFDDAISCAQHLSSLGFTEFTLLNRSNISQVVHSGGLDTLTIARQNLTFPDWGDVVAI